VSRAGLIARALALAVLAAIAGLGLTACGSSGGDDALVVYSGRGEELVGPLVDRYVEETGNQVDVRYGDTAELALLISEEGDRSPADVFWSQSPGATAFLASEGLLAPIDEQVLAIVPERFRGEGGTWVGTSARQRVLVYNEDLVDEADLPDSVLDVVDDTYAGRVAIAPTNGSFQDFVTAFRVSAGDEAAAAWLEGMAANDAPTYPSNSAIVEAVSRGEVPMGLVNHYYNLRFLAEDPGLPTRNHEFAAGDIGALLMPASMSVLASSDKTDEATEFIEFMLSEESQRFFATETFEYPVREGVPEPEGAPPLADLRPPDVDVTHLEDLDTTVEMIQAAGLT
jgi:iron(III) transport system substrate-binding protein